MHSLLFKTIKIILLIFRVYFSCNLHYLVERCFNRNEQRKSFFDVSFHTKPNRVANTYFGTIVVYQIENGRIFCKYIKKFMEFSVTRDRITFKIQILYLIKYILKSISIYSKIHCSLLLGSLHLRQ